MRNPATVEKLARMTPEEENRRLSLTLPLIVESSVRELHALL